MASADVYSAIRTHLETNWAATPLVFENEDYSPTTGVHWIQVEMAGTYYGRESFGTDNAFTDRWEEQGLLVFSVMIPAYAGVQIGRGYLKDMADLFRGVALMSGRLEFLDAKVGFGENVPGDNTNDGNWYRLDMVIDWRVIDR